MGLSNLPAIVKAGSALSTRAPAAAGQLIQGAARVAPAAVQRTPITVEGVSRTVRALPKTSPFLSKKFVVGGTAITASAIAGMGAEELFDILNSAEPDELQAMMIEADNSGASEVADELQSMYNTRIVESQDVNYVDRGLLVPSSDDRDMFVTDNVQRSGLGYNIDEVNRQQVIERAFKSVRATFTLEDLFAMRLFMTTASDEDLLALEDKVFGRP